MGIEPTTSRVNDPSAALKAAGAIAEPAQQQALADDAESHWWTHWRKAVQESPELADVLTAWPTLPPAVRAGVVGMVRASAAGDGAEVGK